MKKTFKLATPERTYKCRDKRHLVRTVRKIPDYQLCYTVALKCHGKTCLIGKYFKDKLGINVEF